MSFPFFSFIIPVYNTEEYIERCIHSCIYQSFKNIEIIIVDDCGSDNSIQIAQKYAIIDKRIKIVYNPKNMGTFLARLEGVKNARGKYCLFLDSDDFVEQTMCEVLHQTIETDFFTTLQYVDILCFGIEFFPKTIKRPPLRPITKTLYSYDILKVFFTSSFVPPAHLCGKVFRRSLFNNLFHDKTPHLVIYEDMIQFFLITLYAKKSMGINNKMYFYTENPQSITRSKIHSKIQRKIDNIASAITYMQQISNPNNHPYFDNAKQRILKLLNAFLQLEYRYEQGAFAYPKACFNSIKYSHIWKTYIRILLFFISLGRIKI